MISSPNVSDPNLCNLCLHIHYLNARSLLSKLDELRVLCLANNYDIVCIVESWLSQDILDSELAITGYTIFRRDRNRHGGGIIIFVKDTLSCTILPSSTSPSMEFISLTFEFCSSKFCISVFYRPPSSDVSYFDELSDIIEKLDIVTISYLVILILIFVIQLTPYTLD